LLQFANVLHKELLTYQHCGNSQPMLDQEIRWLWRELMQGWWKKPTFSFFC